MNDDPDVLRGAGTLAKSILEEQGDLMAVLMVDNGTGLTVCGLPEMPASRETRRAMMRAVGTRFRAEQVRRIIFVTDAYTKRMDALPGQTEPPQVGSLADDPDASEVVMTIEVKITGESRSILYPYTRDLNPDGPNSRIVWGEEVTYDNTEAGHQTANYLLDEFFIGQASPE